MGNRKTYITNQIVKYSQKLDDKAFTANHDGNISARFDDLLLATPTAVSKGDIVPEIIITLDMNGQKIEGIGKPFSEIKLHLAAYRARPEAKAVIHAHPPFATACGLVNQAIHPNLPEAIVSIGDMIPVTPFCMPGAPEQESAVAEALSIADVFLMPGNGVFAIGDSIEQAYLRLELVEHIAKTQFYAKQMGESIQLSQQDQNTLLAKRASLGLGPQQQIITPLKVLQPQPKDELTTRIKQLIQSEIDLLD